MDFRLLFVNIMITEIAEILTKDQVKHLRELFDKAPKQDGKLSAGPAAIKVKNNLELAQDSTEFVEMCQIVNQALATSAILETVVMPVQSTQPIFGYYTKGMKYGQHLDMATTFFKPSPVSPVFDGRFRADVSATIFLSEPDEYEGGQLVVNSPSGIRQIKSVAGSMITYPSGNVHSINEVTSGIRRVVVLWFQSYIKNTEQRELLFNFRISISNLIEKDPDNLDVKQINYVYNNLLRMWGGHG